jgi:class 3 adenylate cyclase/dihydrofolate reductase
MRRLIVSEFVTLDGVMEAPGEEAHRLGREAWSLDLASEDQQQANIEQLFEAEALLLGRVTYQMWAAFWPTAPKDYGLGEWAGGFTDRMNSLPKYVVSRTLKEASWTNSTIIKGNIPEEVANLKSQSGGDILLYGSADLVNSLVGEGLIDEYRLMVFPVILGSGKRLFKDETDTSHLQLVDSRTFHSGVVRLSYQPSEPTPSSKYAEMFAWTNEQIRSLQAAQDPDRVLATVLFTDIVDSTRRASDLGDSRWRRLLDRHDRAARTAVELFRGRIIKTTGDGLLATFDAPTRALQCAFELNEKINKLGLRIRAAIHTGEIEIRGDDVGGIGVHIASRALSKADDGQVVVTRTVRDLATGTDLVFRPLGAVTLRGIPGEWDLFEASVS